MVKTRVISLLGEEGRNERDQIAFCSFNSFLLLSHPQSPLCIAGGLREGKRKRAGTSPALSVFRFYWDAQWEPMRRREFLAEV